MLWLTGCAGPAPPPKPKPTAAAPPAAPAPEAAIPAPEDYETIKIGLLLPLSGPDAALGEALLDAAQLALFERGDPRLVLLPGDTRGDPQAAARAAGKVIDAGAQLIVGPLFGRSVRAAQPVAHQRGINIIGLSNDRAAAGAGVFLMGFSPEEQIRRIVTYAASQGLARFAALIPEGPYGEIVLGVMNQAVFEAGGELTRVELYPPNAKGLFAPVRRLANYDHRRRALLDERRSLRDLGPGDDLAHELLVRLKPLETLGELDYDAVLIPQGGALLRALAPLLPYYEIDPAKIKFLGIGLWDDPALTREPSLQGAWFAGPPPAAGKRFSRRFKKAYGRTPPRIASLAYDAVALAGALAAKPGISEKPDQLFAARRLFAENGFLGIDGAFRFTPGGMAERALAVIEITPRGFKVLSPPPAAFKPPARPALH